MAKIYTDKALYMYIGIGLSLIILAVVIMTLLGNERRKQEVKVLRRQLKEKFTNHSPTPTHSNSEPLSPAEADVELDNLMNNLKNITGGN